MLIEMSLPFHGTRSHVHSLRDSMVKMVTQMFEITEMTRVCSFPGCKSGNASEKKNKLHDLKNKTMFKLPRTVCIYINIKLILTRLIHFKYLILLQYFNF